MNENNDAYLDEDEGIIELEDEDGVVTRFEFVDRAELDGVVYYALIPSDTEDDDETATFVVLKETEINGEAMLTTVDDDDEYNKAGEMFIKRFAEMPDEYFDDAEELDKLDGE